MRSESFCIGRCRKFISFGVSRYISMISSVNSIGWLVVKRIRSISSIVVIRRSRSVNDSVVSS